MNAPKLPEWALRTADYRDRVAAAEARRLGVLEETWDGSQSQRSWAKKHGWPTPWLGFSKAFLDKMFESDDTYCLALQAPGLRLRIPKSSHTLTAQELAQFDEAYASRSWRWLVESLREIRRAVEAGVVVEVDGTSLRSFDSFYQWAHGRYHALEDDVTTGWIGDDSGQR